MTLTASQLTTLRAGIDADPALNVFPNNNDGAASIAALLNQAASPDFLVWGDDAPVAAILDAVDWTKYTPTDAPDGTALFTNRLLVVQTKQMNLQNMLIGRDTLDATRANVRAGLRDATVALPTGAAGAAVSAGGASGVTVLTACARKATRGEKFFATGSATTGTVTANFLSWQGTLTYQDIADARAN